MELYLSVFAALLVTAYGCSEPGRDRSDAPLEEKVYKSDFVAYGTVLETFTDPVYTGKDIYAAAVSVKCTYKGGMLPINITVVGAGKMPRCPEVNLQPKEDYVFLLKSRTDKHFDVEFGPMPGDAQMIDEILIVCDLVLVYTKGSLAEKEQECPTIFDDVQDEEECLRYSPPVYNVNLTTQAPRITTKVISGEIINSEPEGEPEPEHEMEINDSEKPGIKSTGNGKVRGQAVISDKGNGKELYSLSVFLLFTCTAVTFFLL